MLNAQTRTPDDLLLLSKNLGVIVDQQRTRSHSSSSKHLGVRLVEKLPEAPAKFDPKEQEIYLRADLARRMDVNSVGAPDWWRRNRKVAGAIVHETLHSSHSPWDWEGWAEGMPPRVREAAVLLEESRIEAIGSARLQPLALAALRSTIWDLIVQNLDTSGDIDLSAMSALILARADQGTIEVIDPEAKEIVQTLKDKLGEDFYKKARDIWQGYTRCHLPNNDNIRDRSGFASRSFNNFTVETAYWADLWVNLFDELNGDSTDDDSDDSEDSEGSEGEDKSEDKGEDKSEDKSEDKGEDKSEDSKESTTPNKSPSSKGEDPESDLRDLLKKILEKAATQPISETFAAAEKEALKIDHAHSKTRRDAHAKHRLAWMK